MPKMPCWFCTFAHWQKKLSVYNFNGRIIWTMRDRTKKIQKHAFQTGLYMCFLEQGALRVLQDFSPLRCSVQPPIVILVTMVPAALRSLTRSSRVVLGWFLTVLMITETPRGEILHGAPDQGRLSVILCFFHLWIIAPTVVSFIPNCLTMSCSPFQPCVGLQSCPLDSSLVLTMVESLESASVDRCLLYR